MPILPLIGMVLPSLIKLAEDKLGSGKGSEKKQVVLDFLGLIYDKFGAKVLPDLPGVDEKALFLEVMGILIDRLVPSIVG